MALPGAEGVSSSAAGARTNAGTGTTESAGQRGREIRRQRMCNSIAGSGGETGQSRQPTGGGGGGGEGESQRRQPELELEENRRTAAESWEAEWTGEDNGGGDRPPELRERGRVRGGSGDEDEGSPAKPLCMPSPRPCIMDAIAQNSLLGALLSYQDGVAGASYADGDRASRLGHLGLIKMQQACTPLSKRGKVGGGQPLFFTPAAMDSAAESGHLEVVRWLHHNREEGGTSEALIQASANGHKDVVKWLLANRGENDIWRAFGAAAESSPSRNSVSGATAGVAAAAGAAGASSRAASPAGLASGADAHADGGVDASTGGGGGVSKPSACASSPAHVAGVLHRANQDQRLNPVLETLVKALPPELVGLSTREWVSKAAATGRVDFLEWLKKQQEEADRAGTGAVLGAGEGLEGEEQDDGEILLEYPSSALTDAARGGHIEVLDWFLENGVCSEDPSLQHARRRRFHSRGAGETQSGAPTKRSNISYGGGGGGGSNGGCSDGGSSGSSSSSGSHCNSSTGGGKVAVAAAPAHGYFLPAAVPAGGGDESGAARDQQEEKEEPPFAGAPTLRSNHPPATSAVSTNRRANGEHQHQRRRLPGGAGALTAAATAAATRLAKLPLLQQILPLRGSNSNSNSNSNGDGGCVAERAGAEAPGWRHGPGLGRRMGSRRAPPPAEKVLTTAPAVEDAAADAGHLEVLEWLNAHAKPAPPSKPSLLQQRSPFGRSHTKFYGKKSLAQWRRTGGARAGPSKRCSRHALERACESGHFSMAVWLASRRSAEVKRAYDCIRKAAKNGHLEIVAWLSSSREWNPNADFRDRWAAATTAAMDDAAAGGHLEVVRWLHEHRSEGCTPAAMDKAAAAGHLPMVEWLHRHRQEGCTTKAMDLAAAAGHIDVVKWLHENRAEGCSSAAMDGAAEHNRLPTLEWLRQNRVEGWTLRHGAQTAARNGNLTALSYLLLGGKDDAVQRYDDGFGGFAAFSAADSPANGPSFEFMAGGWTDSEGCGRGESGGADGRAGGCCCEGGDDDFVVDGLAVGRAEGSQGLGGGGDAGGNRAEEDGDGSDGGGGDDTGGDVGGGDVDAGADADAAAAADGGADAIDGLRLAGGGGVASPVTLDLDEAATEGRLGVLQWARRATTEASSCPCSRADRENGSAMRRSRNGGRGCGSVCRGCDFGRCGRSPALCNGGGDKAEKAEVQEGEEEMEDEKKEAEEAPGAGRVVSLRCWSQDPDGRDQERKEEEEEAGDWVEAGAYRLKEDTFPPPRYCNDRRYCACRCRGRSSHRRHGSGSVSLPSTAAAPTAIAATAVPTAPVSASRGSAPSAPLSEVVGGGGNGGSSDDVSTVGDAGTTAGADVASTASAAAAACPAAPSDVPDTVASTLLRVNGSDANMSTAATAGCRGNSRPHPRSCCRCESRVADASQRLTDRNGWRHRVVSRLVEDTTPVGDRRRRQGVTDGETGEEDGVAAGGIERAASPPSLGAGINRFRVALSTAAVDGAAGNGHLEVVRWLLFHRGEGGTAAAFETAATNGHVHVLEWLMTHTALRPELRGGSPLWPSALARAAANGHLGVIRWFHRNMRNFPADAKDVSKAVGFTYRLMDEAAGSGHLQICRWLHQHRGEGCSWNAFDGAAAGGHMHVLCWLDDFYPNVGPSAVAFVKAAKAGHLHVLQWLLRRYPGEAEAGCMWACHELSETPQYEPITGIKRNWTIDADVLELVKLAWSSRRKRGWYFDVALGGGFRVKAP